MNKFNKGDLVRLNGTTKYIVIEPKFNGLIGYDDHVEIMIESGDVFNGHRLFASNDSLMLINKAAKIAA